MTLKELEKETLLSCKQDRYYRYYIYRRQLSGLHYLQSSWSRKAGDLSGELFEQTLNTVRDYRKERQRVYFSFPSYDFAGKKRDMLQARKYNKLKQRLIKICKYYSNSPISESMYFRLNKGILRLSQHENDNAQYDYQIIV